MLPSWGVTQPGCYPAGVLPSQGVTQLGVLRSRECYPAGVIPSRRVLPSWGVTYGTHATKAVAGVGAKHSPLHQRGSCQAPRAERP